MTPSLLAALFFTLGTIAAASSYIRNRQDLSNVLICAGISLLLGIIPGRGKNTLEGHLVTIGYLFTIFASWELRKSILPRLTEQILLQVNIVYAFFLFTRLNVWDADQFPVLVLFLLPSIHTLTLVLWKTPFNKWVNVVSFVWFIAMNLAVLGGNFVSYVWSLVAHADALRQSLPITIPAVDAFFLGMSSFLLIGYVFYLFELLPIPSKHESFRSAWQRAMHWSHELDEQYDRTQLKRRFAILILLVQAGFLYIAHTWHLLSDTQAISLSLISFPLIQGRAEVATRATPKQPGTLDRLRI